MKTLKGTRNLVRNKNLDQLRMSTSTTRSPKIFDWDIAIPTSIERDSLRAMNKVLLFKTGGPATRNSYTWTITNAAHG
jgi:hypothetical protein